MHIYCADSIVGHAAIAGCYARIRCGVRVSGNHKDIEGDDIGPPSIEPVFYGTISPPYLAIDICGHLIR